MSPFFLMFDYEVFLFYNFVLFLLLWMLLWVVS